MDRPDRLTMNEVPEFLVRARRQLLEGEARIDLAGLVAVDSSALAALIALRRDAGRVVPLFESPPENLRKLAMLYGVDDLLFAS